MSLDRQSIEKRDFPIGRRGYDPDAVDAHLAVVAADVEELKLSAHRRSETLATSASDQIRAIIEAAENSAQAIETQAETEARAVRAEAGEEASATRADANAQAREYVDSVKAATASLLDRVRTMESDLGELLAALKSGASRLNADLESLNGSVEEVRASVSPPIRTFETEVTKAPERQASTGKTSTSTRALDTAPANQIVDDFQSDSSGVADRAESGGDAAEDARLVALNMALDGTDRETAARYLRANFTLTDGDTLLDEVYASVGG